MHEANNVWNRPYVKCARVVGDVLGKYHPHGDTATYEAWCVWRRTSRCATPWSTTGQFRFGDGDSAAAYRYNRMPSGENRLGVAGRYRQGNRRFRPNYDGKEQEPSVLPTRIPNLLINGSAGIAVGMATNVPPHSLHEIVDACLAILERPEIGVDELMEIIPGPDFPTRGIIYGTSGVKEGYRTGAAGCNPPPAPTWRSWKRATARPSSSTNCLPGEQVGTSHQIGELVRGQAPRCLSEIATNPTSHARGAGAQARRSPEVILNNLYKETQMQTRSG